MERFETRRVRRDGAKFPAFLTVSAIRDADGAVVGTSVIYRELTGRGDNPIRSQLPGADFGHLCHRSADGSSVGYWVGERGDRV